MTKPKLIIVIVCIIFFCTLFSYGQSPVGKWIDSRFNITLILNSDFTYSLTHQNKSSTGQWSSGGNQFCMRDSSVSTPVCYTVISYSSSLMVLRDMNGVVINYQKAGAVHPSAPISKKEKVKGEGRVVAEKGNFKLTHGHLRTGIDLTQFIIGERIKDSEVRELKQKLVEEFNMMPGQVLGQLESIGQSMKKVHSATDPVKVGLVRQEIFAEFYRLTRNMSEEQKPLLIRVINRYIAVLAYDERNNLILTNKDVEGYMNYLVFNSQLSGQVINANSEVRRAVSAQIVANFNSMPLEQKRMLSSASLIWHLFDSNWKRLSNSQKNQYLTAYRQQISNNFGQYAQGSAYGQQWTPPQQTQKKNIAQLRSEFNAKQNMYRMMQNMSTDSHALSLNIIENIGGTGNYWEVVDY